MTSPQPQSNPLSRDLAKQKLMLKIVIGFLLLASVLVVALARSISLPLRLFVGSFDLIAAAVVWLVLRQKFGGDSSAS